MPGMLAIIGGHEDKEGRSEILSEVRRRMRSGPLYVCTVATSDPDEMFADYREAFEALDVKDVRHLDVRERKNALDERLEREIAGAGGFFLTGGKQLKITSEISETPVERGLRALHDRGGIVAGTSAGAAAMPDTMLVWGAGRATHKLGDFLEMAPGLGLVRNVVVDQHFAERGRMGRLVGVIAQNPSMLGIGIDENTAVFVKGDHFRIVGRGSVHVIDGSKVTSSNIADGDENDSLVVTGLVLHVLSRGYGFDMAERRPLAPENGIGQAAACDERT